MGSRQRGGTGRHQRRQVDYRGNSCRPDRRFQASGGEGADLRLSEHGARGRAERQGYHLPDDRRILSGRHGEYGRQPQAKADLLPLQHGRERPQPASAPQPLLPGHHQPRERPRGFERERGRGRQRTVARLHGQRLMEGRRQYDRHRRAGQLPDHFPRHGFVRRGERPQRDGQGAGQGGTYVEGRVDSERCRCPGLRQVYLRAQQRQRVVLDPHERGQRHRIFTQGASGRQGYRRHRELE